MFLNDSPVKSNDRLEVLVSQHWIELASLGWSGYCDHGRGFVVVREENRYPCLSWDGSVSYTAGFDGLDEVLRKTADVAVENYDPNEEIVIRFEPIDSVQRVVAFRSRQARPPEALEKERLPC